MNMAQQQQERSLTFRELAVDLNSLAQNAAQGEKPSSL